MTRIFKGIVKRTLHVYSQTETPTFSFQGRSISESLIAMKDFYPRFNQNPESKLKACYNTIDYGVRKLFHFKLLELCIRIQN